MKSVNTLLFAVLMFMALCLCIFGLANLNTNTVANPNNDSIPTMSKSEFLMHLADEYSATGTIYADTLIAEYFYVIDNSWYVISIQSFEAFLRNHESVERALTAKRKYGDLVELDDILDLD